MKMEWWMLDGGICLIILFSAILGAAKGLGDTLLRILGIGGGIALGVFYSDEVTKYLESTPFNAKVHDKVFELLRGSGIAESGSEGTSSAVTGVTGQSAVDTYEGVLPRVISNSVNDLADKAADAAADRFTAMIMSVLGFVVVVLFVWLLVTLIRFIFKSAKKNSGVLGFADRVAGFVLGTVKGIIVACLAAMLLVPVTTIIAPDSLPAVTQALDQTTVAKVIYDANPLLILIKHLLMG